ncbi:hypothetical protein RRG08_060358 [Elysia crispata]|uniref:Uncharacterized protein n=1 Tax=Elysia crispata TaxID=231223 RepID=A0AAE0ZGK3_9GAST|nr:hypothetical protein RRG08_060358 [Elysia crispata]
MDAISSPLSPPSPCHYRQVRGLNEGLVNRRLEVRPRFSSNGRHAVGPNTVGNKHSRQRGGKVLIEALFRVLILQKKNQTGVPSHDLLWKLETLPILVLFSVQKTFIHSQRQYLLYIYTILSLVDSSTANGHICCISTPFCRL